MTRYEQTVNYIKKKQQQQQRRLNETGIVVYYIMSYNNINMKRNFLKVSTITTKEGKYFIANKLGFVEIKM